MRQISASEVGKNFAYIIDTAQKEPIIVKKNDRDYVAIISMSDYENLVRMKNLRLKKLAEEIGAEARDHGLTSEILEEILNSDS